jgi:iron complex transport system substrate-binding protein
MSLRLFAFSACVGLASMVEAQPQRVVSMNLCTDQLAMMLAAPGQLMSVSYLARDARASSMADQAMDYEVNHGLAEEIYLSRPDLVIAGRYSTFATVDMLRRLEVPVAVIEPARSLEDVRARIAEMGRILGRDEVARALIQKYDAGLAALAEPASDGPSAAIYSARGWTSGAQTLSGQILEAAGLQNIAVELGLHAGGVLPLEQLALAEPDVVITAQPYPGHSRAEEFQNHPVIQSLRARAGEAVMSDRDWICGTPYVLRAIEDLAAARLAMKDQSK